MQLSQDVREPTKHHDMSRHVTYMSHETYLHAPSTKILKNNFAFNNFNPIQSQWVVAIQYPSV